ncbi:MAG: methyltransferase domain-containing protein [Nitrososphaerota archaeon]|nr:methyltransferase domain-containing protein [Nitrososphaerota archaeon]
MEAGQYLRLETTGRTSGTPHQVLLRYIAANDGIVVFPLNTGSQDWVKNVSENPMVKVFSAAGESTGTAQIKEITGLGDPLLSIFTRKYGRLTVNRWYKGQRLYVQVSISKKLGALNYDELVYGDLEAAFDSVADSYDRHIFGNPINTWLRNVSIGVMKTIFRPGSTVLEIGCGTGTETLSLANAGIRVVACDISQKMLDVLTEKARSAGLSEAVVPVHCKPIELVSKMHILGISSLDGAYSTYGTVNTEPNLDVMIRSIHSILKEDAPLILGVWNKYCLYEMMGYTLKLNPGMAFARMKNPVPLGKSRFCVATNAFSVGELRMLLQPWFRIDNVLGVVVTLPPSNLTKYLPNGRLLDFMKRLDLILGRTFPGNRVGDHFLALCRRAS